jgi:uncharacterized Zn-binding protein involved in type VI secretion
MTSRIIVVGDSGSHAGARVVTGSPNEFIDGRAIARKGDLVDCPGKYPGGKPHGVNPITSGLDSFTVDGVPVAVEGHQSACGCVLMGSVDFFVE